MTVLEAAEAVLAAAGGPLNDETIARRAIEAGYWKTEGKTPQQTVHAQLAMNIKTKGTASRFQRTAKGTFALRNWGLPEYTPASKPKEGINPAKDIEPSRPPSTLDKEIKQKAPEKPATLSFTDAAEKVLREFGDKRPMHYSAITKKALESCWIKTAGKTPEATLIAQIVTEISRLTKRGEAPRFVKHGKGLIGLSEWLDTGLVGQIKQHNDKVRQQLRARLHDMPPAEFEGLVGRLLPALGFQDVTVTTFSNDEGIDVRGMLVVGEVISTRMAVQVKRWKKNVQAPVVQQVRGSLSVHDQGLIITTSDFSPGARSEAAKPNAAPIALMNGEHLVALLIGNNIGVHRTSYDLIELGEVGEE